MKTILIIVAVTMACVLGFGAISKFTDGGLSPGTTQVVDDPNRLTTTVTGNVKKPGTYRLEYGKTLLDLLDAAGGTTTNADPLAFDVSVALENKGEYYIAPIYDNSSACATEPIVKANVNRASADELHEVAGFTKSLANAVVSYRASETFRTLEDIMDVPGIGKATYISVRDRLTIKDAE